MKWRVMRAESSETARVDCARDDKKAALSVESKGRSSKLLIRSHSVSQTRCSELLIRIHHSVGQTRWWELNCEGAAVELFLKNDGILDAQEC